MIVHAVCICFIYTQDINIYDREGVYMKRPMIMMTILACAFLLLASGCTASRGSLGHDQKTGDPAMESSSYLTRLNDLKAINIAANFLKEHGLNPSFQETFIQYHLASHVPDDILPADEKALDYFGEYLEVRLYFSDDPENAPCRECTVVYIDDIGNVLGYTLPDS